MVAVGVGHLPMIEEGAGKQVIHALRSEIMEPEEYFQVVHFFAQFQDDFSSQASGQRPFPVSLHLFGDLKQRVDEVSRVIVS